MSSFTEANPKYCLLELKSLHNPGKQEETAKITGLLSFWSTQYLSTWTEGQSRNNQHLLTLVLSLKPLLVRVAWVAWPKPYTYSLLLSAVAPLHSSTLLLHTPDSLWKEDWYRCVTSGAEIFFIEQNFTFRSSNCILYPVFVHLCTPHFNTNSCSRAWRIQGLRSPFGYSPTSLVSALNSSPVSPLL